MGCMSSKQATEGADIAPSQPATTKNEATNTAAPSQPVPTIKRTSAAATSTTSPASKSDNEWWNDTTSKPPPPTPAPTTTYTPSYSSSTNTSGGYTQARGPIYRSYGPSYAYTSLHEAPPTVDADSTSNHSDCGSSM